MLLELAIKNLAIVEQVTLNFASGMNVLTGETGAGKSILLEALNLVLGDRASSSMVRAPHKQAEITAEFVIAKLPLVLQWLETQDLAVEQECIIRRILLADGHSKAYINGNMVTLLQLKQLGELLVNMHSQHQHHALLNTSYQRELLDQYAGHNELLLQVANFFHNWQKLAAEYRQLVTEKNQEDKLQLLNYQLQEIEELALQPGELASIAQEHKKLTKAEDLATSLQKIWQKFEVDNSQNLLVELYKILNELKKLQQITNELAPSSLLIEQAIINLEEAKVELRDFSAKFKLEPEKLALIEERLSKIYALARKHNVNAEFFPEHYQTLLAQRNSLVEHRVRLQEIGKQLQLAKEQYLHTAELLHQNRVQAAKELTKQIVQQMQQLAMPHAAFNIDINKNLDKPMLSGVDEINFLVSTNPGQQLQSLNKIASGGELSRISLAMQMILTNHMQAPVLIFDEVDVGISGATAEIVGKLLRVLGNRTQVLCVTHLPQVAAQGHYHFKVSKQQTTTATTTSIKPLPANERVIELARLLGGSTITKPAIANAEALLASVN